MPRVTGRGAKGGGSQRDLYLMSFPFLFLVLVFHYLPLGGWLTAFQDYRPAQEWDAQTWVGLRWFAEILADPRFWNALTNTLALGFLSLFLGFTVSLFFALALNELRLLWLRRTVQTLSSLPHYLSWVVVSGMVSSLLSTDGGALNALLVGTGVLREPLLFLAKPDLFWGVVTLTDLWKELGWNSILFLAAIAAVDPQLHEAAKVDGAGRWRQMWHITLPGIRPMLAVVLMVAAGNLVTSGFEKPFVLGNAVVSGRSEVLDLYAMSQGIHQGRSSYGTAVGMVNSLIGLFLFLGAALGLKGLGQKVFR